MSDNETVTKEELLGIIKELQQGNEEEESTGWGKKKKKKSGSHSPIGVLVPVSVETDKGKVRTYLQFPEECCSSEDAVFDLVEGLIDKGFPVDAWRGKQNNGWKKNRSW